MRLCNRIGFLVGAVCFILWSNAAEAAVPSREEVTNIVNGLTGGGSSTANAANALNADAFIFFGDSFIADAQTLAGSGNDWPSKLLQTSNYCRYQYSYNFGAASTTTSNMLFGVGQSAGVYGLTNGVLAVKPATNVTSYLFVQSGQNDPDQTMTNYWTTIMTVARANGYKLIAVTAPTNGGGGFQLIHNTNNLYIRARSDLYDYLFDYDQQVTNTAVQYGANLHPTVAENQRIANFLCTNVVPAHSSVFHKFAPGVGRFLTLDGITVSSNVHLPYVFANGLSFSGETGIGAYLHGDGANAFLGGLNADAVTAVPLYLDGSVLIVRQPITAQYTLTSPSNTVGGMNISSNLSMPTATMSLGALGAALTNIYWTNVVIDFPSTIGISNVDQVVTIPGGCSSNDLALVQVPATLQLARLVYTAFTSNSAVYVRLTNTSTNTAVDPPAGMVNLLLFKR